MPAVLSRIAAQGIGVNPDAKAERPFPLQSQLVPAENEEVEEPYCSPHCTLTSQGRTVHYSAVGRALSSLEATALMGVPTTSLRPLVSEIPLLFSPSLPRLGLLLIGTQRCLPSRAPGNC